MPKERDEPLTTMSVRGGSIKGENPVSLRLSGNSMTSTIYDGAMEVYSTKLMQWNGRRGVLNARYLSLYTNEIEEDFGTLKDIVPTSEIDHVRAVTTMILLLLLNLLAGGFTSGWRPCRP